MYSCRPYNKAISLKIRPRVNKLSAFLCSELMRSDNPVQPKIKQTYTVQLIWIWLMMLIMQLIDFQSDVKANTPTVYVNQLKLICIGTVL